MSEPKHTAGPWIAALPKLLATCEAVKLIADVALLTTGQLQAHEVKKIQELTGAAIAKATEGES